MYIYNIYRLLELQVPKLKWQQTILNCRLILRHFSRKKTFQCCQGYGPLSIETVKPGKIMELLPGESENWADPFKWHEKS